MLRWGSAAVLSLVCASVAHAEEPVTDVRAAGEPGRGVPTLVGYGAMPGGRHAPSAELLPRGTVDVVGLSGYGYRKGLLSDDHEMHRAIGELAITYAPLDYLMFGISADGQYDKHAGLAMDDEGGVGALNVLLRLGTRRGALAYGGQLSVWVPGEKFPSLAGSAIAYGGRALLAYDAGVGTVSVNAGFRIDHSAESVADDEMLSIGDQASLRVSDYHAVLAGAAFRLPVGRRAYASVEASTEVFVGDDAPGPIVRGGALFGVALTDVFSALVFVEAAKVPGLDHGEVAETRVVTRVAYEPLITAGLGLQARFGGGGRSKPATSQVVERPAQPASAVEFADVRGLVVDEAGKPVVGATVAIVLRGATGSAITDDKGAYAITRLPIGKTVDGVTQLDDTTAEVTITVTHKKPGATTLVLVKGANTVPRIALDPMLPPGQLRGLILNVRTSRPVANATITIEPGGATATSGSDGKFTVDLPPGQYKITVNARGLAQQQLGVNIEQNGVAIKNIDMHP